ncbi:MAG: BamA/OMP85 family outer membrane protein [Melioribacteraceae bacterium]
MIIKIINDLIRVNHNNQRYPRSIKNITLIFLLLFTTNSFAQTISKIEITGENKFSKSDYFNWIKISTGTKYFSGLEDSVKSRIASALEERGYFYSSFQKVVLEKIDSVRSSLLINLNEGKPTLINKIKFGKTVKDTTQIAGILSQLENAPLTNAKIGFALSEVLDYYENIGYPFSSIRIESVELINPSVESAKDSANEDHFANLILYIDEGVKSKIDKIEIQGNDRTKDFVITRALQFRKGEEYSQKKIDEIPERLNRLRFFEPVEQPAFYFNSKQEGVLKISVKEKQTNYFDGIIGYVPAVNDKERGYLTGFINVNLRNLFGTGRAASFRWQQENRSSQELELHYLEPWLFDLPFNISGSLFQRKQDSTYVQRNLEGNLEYLATDEISASIIIGTQSTIPSALNSQNFTVFNSSSLSTGVNFRIDTRDDFYAPTKGIYLNNSYKFISKKINGPAAFITPDTKTNVTLQRLEFDFTIFNQFFQRQVAAIGVHGRELRGDNSDMSDLYFLGGTNTLRGYREKQFQGNRIFWSNLEYRLLLSKRSYTFLFFDTGYFLRNEDKQKNIPESSSFKIGYGFGLNIETGLGVLGVSFALAKGDSFGKGKIHFGIINEF